MHTALRLKEEALDQLRSELHYDRIEGFENYLNASARFFPYGWINCLLIAYQQPQATYLAKASDWRNLGRSIRREEIGITIFDDFEGAGTGRPGRDERVPVERTLLMPLRSTVVFDVRQTSGRTFDPLHDPLKLHLARLRETLAKSGMALEYTSAIAPHSLESTAGRIRVLPGLPPESEFATLTHEFANYILHDGGLVEPANDRAAERQAGAVAFIVCRGVGLDPEMTAQELAPEFKGKDSELGTRLWRLHEVSSQILSEVVPERDLAPAPSKTSKQPGRDTRDRDDAPSWDR